MEIYAGMVENLDANVGRIIQYLKQNNLYDNTLIFLFLIMAQKVLFAEAMVVNQALIIL